MELIYNKPENFNQPASSLTTLPASELVKYDESAFYGSMLWIVGVALVTIGAIVFLREKFKDFIEEGKK